MKQLTLVRHAKSSKDDPSIPDFDRPLNRRGKEEAPEMGRRLAARGLKPDAVVTSPAKRARSTARKIARELGYALQAIREDEAVYDASLATLVEIVRGLDERWEHVLLVGHNPGFAELADSLSAGAVRDLPTCAVVGLGFPSDTWREAAEGHGTVLFFDSPKRSAAEP
jgi:phosphohistidine phosphatase